MIFHIVIPYKDRAAIYSQEAPTLHVRAADSGKGQQWQTCWPYPQPSNKIREPIENYFAGFLIGHYTIVIL